MAEITRLETKIALPLPEDGEWSYDYQRKLNGEIEKELAQNTNEAINLLLDRAGDSDVIYLGVPDPVTSIYPNGTWRIRINDSNELSREKMVGGSWTVVLVDDV